MCLCVCECVYVGWKVDWKDIQIHLITAGWNSKMVLPTHPGLGTAHSRGPLSGLWRRLRGVSAVAPFPPGCGALIRQERKHDRDKKVEAHSSSSEYSMTWFLLYGYRHGSTVIHAASPLDMRVYSHQKLHLSLHYLQNIGLGEKMRRIIDFHRGVERRRGRCFKVWFWQTVKEWIRRVVKSHQSEEVTHNPIQEKGKTDTAPYKT